MHNEYVQTLLGGWDEDHDLAARSSVRSVCALSCYAVVVANVRAAEDIRLRRLD